MSENTRKNKRSNDTGSIITSPDGIPIRITAGNKLKFITALQNAPTAELGDIQRRIYARLIDKTNEGYGDDPERYGHAYPSFETLAKECGCTKRAVMENIAALETGVTKNGRIIPERWRIKVKRKGERGKGGAGNVNMYWLPPWNEFGAVENSERDTTETMNAKHGKGERDAHETMNAKQENGEPHSPDSASYPASGPTFKDTLHPDCAGADQHDDQDDDLPGELQVPENWEGMSPRDMFEFLRNGYGNSRPEDSDGEWAVFEEALESGHLTLPDGIESINMDREAGKTETHTFLEFLESYIWDDDNFLDWSTKSRWKEEQERKASLCIDGWV
jgi:hypothetical protein